jgi:hypothetical protein
VVIWNRVLTAHIAQTTFMHQRLLKEEVFLNYIVIGGDWIEEPPTSLNFNSCKTGPVIFVNEVIEKKVIQIWKWDTVQGVWSSIREGETFHTSRERTLEIDKNMIPRLRAVRNRKPRSKDTQKSGDTSILR